MKKKKILALVLAASMAGGMLAGCGSTSGGDETAKSLLSELQTRAG